MNGNSITTTICDSLCVILYPQDKCKMIKLNYLNFMSEVCFKRNVELNTNFKVHPSDYKTRILRKLFQICIIPFIDNS